jgi:hypothetical protein
MVETGLMTWTYCDSFPVCQSRAGLGMEGRCLDVPGSTAYCFPD